MRRRFESQRGERSHDERCAAEAHRFGAFGAQRAQAAGQAAAQNAFVRVCARVFVSVLECLGDSYHNTIVHNTIVHT